MHILQITNHGLHEWQVTPGLPDTGGQNVYVNHMSAALVRLGHRVTIVNRGGYRHPLTGEIHTGAISGLGGRARIVYLTDGTDSFVRKEDMHSQLPALASGLVKLLEEQPFDLIISHYWDGAVLGLLANGQQTAPLPHIWIPHSLGALKRRNVDPGAWEDLRIDDRIAAERRVLETVDGVAATSVTIRDSIRDDYQATADFFLPPGVDEERFRPRSSGECRHIWVFLAEALGTPEADLTDRPLILEVSRTDATKRKDVLLRAFARVRESIPDALLAITIDDVNAELHGSLLGLIEDLRLGNDVVVLGSVWDQLPCLYTAAAAYCTPSVMEGFGMSAQEATASGTPVVASNLVPFVSEYLLGNEPAVVAAGDSETILVGEGAIVVPADSVHGFATALALLLDDSALRGQMGRAARRITVPAFGWERLTSAFLDAVGGGQP